MPSIQIGRSLNEEEVRQINFIIKSRAHRYIAAGQEEWLYPEEYVSKSDWNGYGLGYLLMPDPRGLVFTRGFVFGDSKGNYSHFDAHGRRPGQDGFNYDENIDEEFSTLEQFKSEFARLFGPKRRGRAFNLGQMDPIEDSKKMHDAHLKRGRT